MNAIFDSGGESQLEIAREKYKQALCAYDLAQIMENKAEFKAWLLFGNRIFTRYISGFPHSKANFRYSCQLKGPKYDRIVAQAIQSLRGLNAGDIKIMNFANALISDYDTPISVA